MQFIWQVLLMLDGAIYDLISYVFSIFYDLAGMNIFSNANYQGIVERIYIILGIFMLFVLTYTLLKAVINPDQFAKGDNSFPNLVKNVIISMVVLMVLPTVFSVAFNIQNSVLNNNTISRLILGVGDETQNVVDADNLDEPGRQIVFELFNAFFSVNKEYCEYLVSGGEADNNVFLDAGYTEEDCRSKIIGNGTLFFRNGDPLPTYDEKVYSGSSFTYYMEYSEAVAAREINYLFPVSTIAGIFFLFVMLNFTFDMAIRVIKLAFYQLIAPIPVICRILPGGNMKDVFSKWVKQIISVFVEVFIRIAILAIGVYLIQLVINYFAADARIFSQIQDPLRGFITKAILIMGVVIFIKQAPKIIGDLLGLDTSGMKLGLMDKLAMGGAFAAGSAVGSFISSGGNPLAAVRGLRYGSKNKDFRVIGQEAAYARDKREARAAGVTRADLFVDRWRRRLGFDSRYDAEMRNVDNQVAEIDAQIADLKQPLLDERINDRVAGNNAFNEAKDAIENRVKDKLYEKKSNYMADLSFDFDELVPSGVIGADGNPIMTTQRRRFSKSGNLLSLREYITKNPDNLDTQVITRMNQKLDEEEKRLVSQYVRDSVNQNQNSDGGKDGRLSELIKNIQSDAILNGVLMNADGTSGLSPDVRNAILTSDNLWDVLDDFGKEVSNANGDLSRRVSDINQSIVEFEHRKQTLEASRGSETNRRYRASSNVTNRPPGGGGGGGDHH